VLAGVLTGVLERVLIRVLADPASMTSGNLQGR
jgi:hypothetical protein